MDASALGAFGAWGGMARDAGSAPGPHDAKGLAHRRRTPATRARRAGLKVMPVGRVPGPVIQVVGPSGVDEVPGALLPTPGHLHGLSHLAALQAKNLSSGVWQRVLLLMALLAHAHVLQAKAASYWLWQELATSSRLRVSAAQLD